MVCDRRLESARRAAVASLFAIAAFVAGAGAIACHLFHDGMLPDDARLSGWAAVFSFAKAFLMKSGVVSCAFVAAGLLLRRRPWGDPGAPRTREAEAD